MPCRSLSPEVLRSARTLEDVYTAVGVLKPAAGGDDAPLPPPRTFLPEGREKKDFPYLTGTDGRNFNLAPLFAGDREQYNCALSTLGYNETRAQELATETASLTGEQFTAFLDNLPASEALSFNIYRTLTVLEFMRGAGNADRNRDVISAPELESWAWKASGQKEDAFRKMGGDVISRLHAFLGIASFLASESADAAAEIDAGAQDAAPDASSDVPQEASQETSHDVVIANDAVAVAETVSHSDAGVLTDATAPLAGVETSPPPATTAPQTSSPWATALVAGVIGGLVGAGATMAVLRRNPTPTPPAPPTAAAPTPPPPPAPPTSPTPTAPPAPRGPVPPPLPTAKQAGPNTAAAATAKAKVGTVGVDNYGDILRALESSKSEGSQPGRILPNPFNEIWTASLNDEVLLSSLQVADPALADFYRQNISTPVSPVTTVADLFDRINALNNGVKLTFSAATHYPTGTELLTKAYEAVGVAGSSSVERVAFELIAQGTRWNPEAVGTRATTVDSFASSYRTAIDGTRGPSPEDAEGEAKRETEQRRESEIRPEGR